MGSTLILFDLAAPPLPESADGSWVEVRVAQDHVTVWPYELCLLMGGQVSRQFGVDSRVSRRLIKSTIAGLIMASERCG
ncbi:hypothetical protein ACFWOT_12255 [Streptomyces sp. NPDC058440]|uniref:hypothetical protein n=1 Tax=Streptomyces sp. NPDC058440 TaxID=3346501 RepID=UPI0036640DAA